MLSVERVLSSREVAWEHALTSRLNVRYYQRLVSRWKRWDVGVRFVCAAAASATIINAARQHSILGIEIAAMLAVVSAALGVAGATLRLTDKARELDVLLNEYTSHTHRFQKLYHFGCTDDELRAALDAFAETEIRESKDPPDDATLEKCRQEVLASIRVLPT